VEPRFGGCCNGLLLVLEQLIKVEAGYTSWELTMIERIVVATDGSKCAREAAEYAVSIASKYGAKIIAIYVVDELFVDKLVRDLGYDKEELKNSFGRAGLKYVGHVAESAKRNGVDVEELVTLGVPEKMIVSEAREQKADLIVMGMVGEGGEKPLLGSVTERVLNSAPCPVLVVKPSNSVEE